MGPMHQLAGVEPPSRISKLKPTPASSTTPSSTHPPPQSQPGVGAALDICVDLGGDGVLVRDARPEPDGDGHVLERPDDGGHPRLRGRPPTPGLPMSTLRPPAPKPSRPAPSSYPSVKQQDRDKLSPENDPWADWGQVQNVQKTMTIDELEQYLSEETVPVAETASFNILEHWKVYASKYPILARIARDIFAIPASTVASESTFSTGERVISDYRSSLASDTVEALICLQDCLRSHESNEDNIAGNLIGGDEEKDSSNLST